MIVKNKFRDLLKAKADKDDRRNIPLTEVERETEITWRTLQAWDKDKLKRFDGDTIAALCDYFDVDIGDLLYLAPNGDGPEKSDPAA